MDRNGQDAILINKEVDAAPMIEHMGGIFEDENGDWYYFYWGDTVKFESIENPDEVLKSMNMTGRDYQIKNIIFSGIIVGKSQ